MTVNFSQVSDTNADTTSAAFGFSQANFNSNPQNNVQSQNTTEISLQPCSNDPADPNVNRRFDILFTGKPVAGRAYTLTYGSPTSNIASYSNGGLTWVSSGTLVVQSVSSQTVTFTVHANMGPVPTEAPGANPAHGFFTVDLSGTVGITGL